MLTLQGKALICPIHKIKEVTEMLENSIQSLCYGLLAWIFVAVVAAACAAIKSAVRRRLRKNARSHKKP
jgi:hypothetical protein